MVRASGFVVGPTGVHFLKITVVTLPMRWYTVSTFEPNQLDGQNLNDVIEKLSGNVHIYLNSKRAKCGLCFCWPYPSSRLFNVPVGRLAKNFRVFLEEQDLPNTICVIWSFDSNIWLPFCLHRL